MDAVALRKGLSARVGTVTGLREAQGPLGLEMEPSTVISRSYKVAIVGDTTGEDRARPGVQVLIAAQFEVRIAHRLPIRGGAEARDQAHEDAGAVIRALLNPPATADTLVQVQNTITYRGGTHDVRGGGAYLLTTQQWSCRYYLTLVA